MPSITDVAKQSISAFTGKTTTNPIGTGPKSDISNAIAAGLIGGVSRATNQNIKDNLTLLADFRLGAVLSKNKRISGTTANIIDSVIGLARGDSDKRIFAGAGVNVTDLNVETKFVPIVIKTNQPILKDEASGKDKEFYVVFDSTPENIVFSKSANWSPKEVPGRPEPIQVFNSSAPVTFSLSGHFFARSKAELMSKLALGESLMALVTPSKNFHMPSTVTVMIGEWQTLRCIVNSVTVNYQGPWWIPSDSDLDIRNKTSDRNQPSVATGTAVSYEDLSLPPAELEYEMSARRIQADQASKDREALENLALLPSHAPYYFVADFQFTTVSQGADVKYAEDILDSRLSADVVLARIKSGNSYTLTVTDENGEKSIVSIPTDVNNLEATATAVKEYHNAGTEYGPNTTINDYLAKVRENALGGAGNSRETALLGSLTNNVGNAASNALRRVASKNKGILGKLFR